MTILIKWSRIKPVTIVITQWFNKTESSLSRLYLTYQILLSVSLLPLFSLSLSIPFFTRRSIRSEIQNHVSWPEDDLLHPGPRCRTSGWSDRVEDLVDNGDVDGVISLLEFVISNLETLGSSSLPTPPAISALQPPSATSPISMAHAGSRSRPTSYAPAPSSSALARLNRRLWSPGRCSISRVRVLVYWNWLVIVIFLVFVGIQRVWRWRRRRVKKMKGLGLRSFRMIVRMRMTPPTTQIQWVSFFKSKLLGFSLRFRRSVEIGSWSVIVVDFC